MEFAFSKHWQVITFANKNTARKIVDSVEILDKHMFKLLKTEKI